MHDQDHKPGHLPPADLPQHRTVMGFRPHIFVGGLVLIAILIIYLLSFVNGTPRAWFRSQRAPAATSPDAGK